MTLYTDRHGRAGRVVLAALVLLTVGGARAAAMPVGHPAVDDLPQADVSITRVERVLAEQLDGTGVSGGAVALVSQGRVDTGGVGDAGRDRAVRAKTPFVIGSASKSFTALAVMQLVDSGRVDLEKPVQHYVPEFELAKQDGEDITVRDLLQQTSGLDDLAGGPLLASAADGTPLAAIAELKDAELAATPGEAWLYANANYVLAGLVVERASGLGYADYVQSNIFDPLGMSHSSATTEPVGSDVHADGHRFWFGVPIATEATRREATLAAGYLTSTAADLGRYLSMYLTRGLAPDGTRIVSAEGARTLLGGGPHAVLGSWAAPEQDSRYAMGWFVGGPWGEDAVFHPGNTPDTTTMLTLFPDRGVAVAVVVNAGNELPVPGNPFIADRVTRNVVHAALGQRVVGLPSIWRFYALFDLTVLVLLGGAVWGLLQAARTVTAPSPSRHPVRGWVGVLVRTLVVGVLVLLPTLSYGWGGLWTWAPDLAVVVAALALLVAAAATLRVLGLLRAQHLSRGDAST
jgi:CubicO group peptidase (beta-lactamase class C family)